MVGVVTVEAGVDNRARLNQDDEDVHSVDRHSIASTVGTTTSLVSRMRDLNLDFGGMIEDKDADEGKDPDRALQSPLPEDSEEERAEASGTAADDGEGGRAGALSEEDLPISHTLHMLQRDPPLQVCCRLFDRRSHPPLPLKRLSMVQVEDFRQHGYVVMDNFISKEAAARIKAETLRLGQRGMLQLVSPANLGVLSTPAGGIGMPLLHSTLPGLNSSPCSTCSSHSQHGGGYGFPAGSSCSTPQQFPQQQQQQQHIGLGSLQQLGNLQQQLGAMHQQQQQQQRWGELRMPLALGHPPADTAVFAPVMAALQDLQDDLSEFVRLRSRGSAEYCLCQLPPGGLAVPRHRDALPDDGRSSSSGNPPTPPQPAGAGPSTSAGQQQQQQQNGAAGPSSSTFTPPAAAAASATGAAGEVPGSSAGSSSDCCDAGTATQQQQAQQPPAAAAGADQAAPPARRVSLFVFVNPDWDREAGGGLRLWPPQRPVGPPSATAASAAARRSPTSSDAGTTFSEISDCGSLRLPVMGSTTSSVIAEASAPDHDTYSLDGLSVAESEVERQGFEWVECEGGEMALDIAPLAGRVVVMLSGAVEHALLPGGGQGPGSDMVFVRAWCC